MKTPNDTRRPVYGLAVAFAKDFDHAFVQFSSSAKLDHSSRRGGVKGSRFPLCYRSTTNQ
jgi:hypothetical protein